MKKILIALLAITLFFTGFAVIGNSKESIVICCSSEEFRNEEMERQLKKQFPNKNITVKYKPTGQAAAKIYGEGKRTEIDIVVGLETGYMNKISDYLEDISDITDKSEIEYLDGLTPADNGNLWVTWEKQAGAIIVNRRVLNRYKLKTPTCYEDLLDPQYKGKIEMPNPQSSGTGYFFYKSWVNAWGEEKALKYIDELEKNILDFTTSGSGPIKDLKNESIAVGLALTFQAVSEINDNFPFEIIYPKEGSPYSLTGTAIIKGHRSKSGVEEVFEYIINEFFLYDKEHYSPELVYQGQTIAIENYPSNIVYADMTGIQDDKEKERLLDLWKY